MYHEEGEYQDKPALHGNEPVLRASGNPPPCRRPEGCPKGTPEKPNTLTQDNWRCFEFVKGCQLTGRWPEDSIVIRNALIIAEIEDEARQRQQQDSMAAAFMQALALMRGGSS